MNWKVEVIIGEIRYNIVEVNYKRMRYMDILLIVALHLVLHAVVLSCIHVPLLIFFELKVC